MPWHPTRVPTTHIRWPPSKVHCATHERQPVCNPMSKTQTRHPKTPPKGYPNGGQSPDWVDTGQPSPMWTGLHPTLLTYTQIVVVAAVKLRVLVRMGNGHKPCHHRKGGLIWTRFLLVWLDIVNLQNTPHDIHISIDSLDNIYMGALTVGILVLGV